MSANRAARRRNARLRIKATPIITAQTSCSLLAVLRRYSVSATVLTFVLAACYCIAFPVKDAEQSDTPQQIASVAYSGAVDPLDRLSRLNHRLPSSQPNATASLAAMEGYSESNTNLMLAGFGGGGGQGQQSTTIDYIYDGQNMVRTRNNGGPGATYLTGPRGPEYRRDDVTGQIRWYLPDGTGNIIGEVDPNGNVTSSRKLDVFGQLRGGNTPGGTSKHKFQGGLGHLSEDETGLTYMRAPYFDPITGRFSSEDSAQQGHNWFAYANNNPVNLHDFTGKSLGTEEDTAAANTAAAYLQATGGSIALAIQRLAYAASIIITHRSDQLLRIMDILEEGSTDQLERALQVYTNLGLEIGRTERAQELLEEFINRR